MKNKVFFTVIGIICACALLVMPCMSEASEKVIKMRVIHAYPGNTQHGRNAEKFKELAERYTNGRLAVTLYPNSSVCSITQELATVLSGGAEASYNINGIVESIDHAEAIWTIPYLVRTDVGDIRHLRKALRDPGVEGVLKKRQEKLGFHRFGSFTTCDGFGIYVNKRPIKTLEDFKGLKIRTPGGLLGDLFFKQLGANFIVVPGTEVPIALQTGIIDGLSTAALHWHDARWHTKYATLPYWCSYTLPFMASLKWWNTLPNDIKNILDNKVIPEVMELADNQTEQLTAEAWKTVQKPPYNVQVYTMPKSEVLRIKNATQEVCIKKFRDVVGKDVADPMIQAVRKLTPPDLAFD